LGGCEWARSGRATTCREGADVKAASGSVAGGVSQHVAWVYVRRGGEGGCYLATMSPIRLSFSINSTLLAYVELHIVTVFPNEYYNSPTILSLIVLGAIKEFHRQLITI
jgi:hypothetical protein